MPVQQGVMSAYQLMPHTHKGIGQGGIIRNDFLYQGCGCFAYRTVAQAIVTNTVTKVLFDAERYDIGADFDADGVDSNFSAPEDGYYYIDAHITFEALADGKIVEVNLVLGGATLVYSRLNSGLISDLTVCASVLRFLTAGQLITVQVWHDHGANRNILGGDAYSYISIFKIGE